LKVRARGFTLTEVVVSVAIVATLAALLFPVFAKAKEKAIETECVSNFRQIHLALSAYRSMWDGTDSPAPSDQMGFPMFLSLCFYDLYDPRWVDNPVEKCRGRGYALDMGPGPGYVQAWAPPKGWSLWRKQAEEDWIRHVTKMGPGSIVVYDPNHQLQLPISNLSVQRALGLRLDGSAKWRVRRGSFFARSWWED